MALAASWALVVMLAGAAWAGSAASPCWTVTAAVERVLDGDTFVAQAAVWLGSAGSVYVAERVRVQGVNTPEVTGATKAAGLIAKDFTERWLDDRQSVVSLEVCRRDSFGRVLAVVRGRDGASLGEALLASGNAVKFP